MSYAMTLCCMCGFCKKVDSGKFEFVAAVKWSIILFAGNSIGIPIPSSDSCSLQLWFLIFNTTNSNPNVADSHLRYDASNATTKLCFTDEDEFPKASSCLSPNISCTPPHRIVLPWGFSLRGLGTWNGMSSVLPGKTSFQNDYLPRHDSESPSRKVLWHFTNLGSTAHTQTKFSLVTNGIRW
jgi:hypothetical protein